MLREKAAANDFIVGLDALLVIGFVGIMRRSVTVLVESLQNCFCIVRKIDNNDLVLAVMLPIEPRAYGSIRVSPDGQQLVINEADNDNSVWIWNFERQTQTRLSLGEMGGDSPIWTALRFLSRSASSPCNHTLVTGASA